MKKITIPNGIFATIIPTTALAGIILTLSACAAPDPELQKKMDQDILTAAEGQGAANGPGPRLGKGSQAYGHGGF